MKHVTSAEQLKRGDRIVVTIKRLGINGEGVGYFRRKAVFVAGALPEEVVKVEVQQVETNFLSGRLLEIEKKSAHRIAPACPVYTTCGGCQLQHADQTGQLAWKTELVREAFLRYVGEPVPAIRPLIGMERPWRYRNKAQFRFGSDETGRVTLGLFAQNSHSLIEINDCLVQPESMNRILSAIVDFVRNAQIPVYDERRGKGVLRSLVVRISDVEDGAHPRFQLTFVTATSDFPQSLEMVAAIRAQHPEVVSIAQNVNWQRTSRVFGAETRVLWGVETLRVSLQDLTFDLSPAAFFQLNASQTIHLYNEVLRAAQLQGNERVIDAYCGTGTIGLWLARHARDVRGIETAVDAVRDARANAKRNGIANASFHVGKVEELLPQWMASKKAADVIIVDPPRSGCDRKLLQALVRARIRTVIYVSCNPATLAKDCRTLLDGGYRIEYVQPVDMFPQTSHVECVVRLSCPL